MRLYSKGLLAFTIVIVMTVVVVIALVGERTQMEFRQYSVLNSSRAQNLSSWLSNYYRENQTWTGLQSSLQEHETGRRGTGQGAASGQWDYQVMGVDGIVVGDSAVDNLTPSVKKLDLNASLPLYMEDQVIGYLVPSGDALQENVLDVPAQQFLTEVQQALLIGSLVAFIGALAVAAILMRSIVNPVRALTDSAEQIAQGDLDVRASIQGKDEIAILGKTFNAMAENLQQAELARQSQTADIAHELRNPLTVLQGTLEALSDQIYEPTPENLQPALDQVHTLNRLISDLRTLALADAGQLQLNLILLDLDDLVSRVSNAYQARFNQHGLTLRTDIIQPLPQVHGDPERLTQVLNNLFSNAIRYVPSGCTINLSLHPHAHGVELRFSDNGPGLSEPEIKHVFERFWRAEPSRSRVTGGSGLGLSIAQQIITAHKGHLNAEPTPNGGLTLVLWLPASLS